MDRFLQKNCSIFLIVTSTALLIISFAYFIGSIAGVPAGFMTEDPLQTANMPFYTGMLANLGAMLWAGIATCGFLGYFLFYENNHIRWFFFATGVWMGYLGLDDLFMFHERLLRYNLHLPEKGIFTVYIILMVSYLLLFRRDILLNTDFPFLFLALFFYGLSMGMDIFLEYSSMETFVEDSFKFIALALLFTYYFLSLINLSRRKFLQKNGF